MQIGFVLFPNVTQLDFTGPLQFLSRVPDATVSIIAETLHPVPSDTALSIPPTHTFETAPALDLVCVPGGGGVMDALGNARLIKYLSQASASASYVTSVCTGAFLLGRAGLLNGRRATTHWGYTHLLPLVGATYEAARVVRDGHVITGGGVTAGIDFALTVLSEIAGEETAKTIQLALEYDPAPPFPGGHPSSASSQTLTALKDKYYHDAARRMARALNAPSL